MSRPLRLLVAEASSFSQEGLAAFARLGQLTSQDVPQSELAARAADQDVLIVRLGLRVNASVLAAASTLRYVVTPTTGLDHIDLQAAQARGIEVLSLKGERQFLDQVFATAEHTLALMFALLRRIPAAFESAKAGQWRRDLYRGRELNSRTLGIVGCGRLGSMLAGYAQGLQMRVLAYDPYLPQLPAGVERAESLGALLATSDIVSLHVPLNEETTGMLGANQFQQMKAGAVLINTARGAVLDEASLLEALQSGRLAGAALDVLANEERIAAGEDHPLLAYARQHDNLIITPHIGGATYESVVKADLFAANKLANRLNQSAGGAMYINE
jgi:D-3-phosphoglycerate dehydrogenase